MENKVILVDENDIPRGVMNKMEAHLKGELHRAFSVFIFNSKGEMLLQKRALDKYHSGGLWTNACCSHPLPDENLEDSVHQRLQEEMGFDCPLIKLFHFTYKADLNNKLIEHELDHVFLGYYDNAPNPNAAEVAEWIYMDIAALQKNIKQHPEQYTYWFKLVLPKVLASI